jgi:polar amino acid transport system substrate-binding protein
MTIALLFGLENQLEILRINNSELNSQAIASELSSGLNSEFNSLNEIQKRGKLIIGVKDNLPSLGFRDHDRNFSGLEIDIARELAKELNVAVEFVPLKNRDRLAAIQNNQVDLAIAQITVTANRSRLIDFSLPYYTDSTIAIAKVGILPQDLRQPISIIVLKNSVAIAVVQSQFPQAVIIGANSYAEALNALQAGKVKAFVGDRTNLNQWLKEHPDYTIIGQPLALHSLAIGLPRGLSHLDLREQVFQIVEKWRKNGWLQQKANNWGL